MPATATLDETFHYPPELLALLVDAISVLCRSKRDVLLFLRGAGVPDSLVRDLEAQVVADRDSIFKHEIVRTTLERLNAAGDATLGPRREVIKRVTETDSFTTCWPKDVYKARALVGEIRSVVNVKDSFTRINLERKREHVEHVRAKEEELAAVMQARLQRETVCKELSALFADVDPHERATRLEKVLNKLFALDGISVRDAFSRLGHDDQGVIEQVDGVIELDGHLYLVEVKWLQERVGTADISQHLVRVFGRGEMRGLFISASGFTDAAIETCREALGHRLNVLCELKELVLLLEGQGDLRQFFKAKIEAAALDKRPLYQPLLRLGPQ